MSLSEETQRGLDQALRDIERAEKIQKWMDRLKEIIEAKVGVGNCKVTLLREGQTWQEYADEKRKNALNEIFPPKPKRPFRRY